MTHLLIFLLFLKGLDAAVDPCISYSTIDEPHRSKFYEPGKTDTLICDRNLTSGWYRFAHNKNMPTGCVDRNHCGTHVPIYLEQQLPPNDSLEHTMTACMNLGFPFGKRCCQDSLNIKVKNCGNYYVYYLVRTGGCSMAYCADPYPKLKQFPELVKPTFNRQGQPVIGCKVHYDPGQPNAGQLPTAFNVSWTVDDKVVTDNNGKPIVKTLTGNERVAFLDAMYLHGHLNKNVDKSSIIIKENEPEQEITLESTIPIPCTSIDQKDCSLTVELKASDDPQDTSTKYCTYDLKFDNNTGTWKTTIKIKATRDFLDDGDKAHVLAFEDLKPTDPSQGLFYNAKLPQVQISTIDVKHKTCSAVTDPHMTSLDGVKWDMYKIGYYVFYKAPNRHFEVQIETYDCGRYYKPCVCSVVAREGNDVIELNYCPQHHDEVPSPKFQVLSSNQLTGITWSKKMDTSGKKFYIDFPSGARLVLDTLTFYKHGEHSPYINVHLDAPSDDFGRVEGLCGTFDDNKFNEFTDSDGNVKDKQHINDFIRSWKVTKNETMFYNVPKYESNLEIGREYCTCTNKMADCTKGKGSSNPQKNHCTHKCLPAIPTTVHRRYLGNQYSDDNHDAHIPVDKSLFHNSFMFNFGHMNAYDEACVSEVMRNVSNYRYGSDRLPIPPDDVTIHRCPNQCSLKGTCSIGQCQCLNGWTGSDCGVQDGVPPTIHRIRGNNACDIRTHPCQKAYIIAGNLHNTETLVCKYKKLQDQSETVVAGQFRTFMEVVCPLPPSDVLTGQPTQQYELSVSNDGILYSGKTLFTVFDSYCKQCDASGRCSLKPNTCLIDGHCHREGEQNALHQECIPSKSTASWTTSHTAQEIDYYTASFTGCPCAFDRTRFDCACCQNSGCQCGEIQMNQCVDCGSHSQCGQNPQLFPPPA